MRSYFETITPATSEPFSVSDAKTFMRVDTTADDTLIGTLITAARVSAEKITNRLLQTQTLRVSFPVAEVGGFNRILRAPINTIDSVETWSGTAFAAFSNYFLNQSNSFPEICYTSSPPIHTDIPFNIQVQFQAGYSALPSDLVLALKQHVAFLYENRGDTPSIGKLPVPVESNFIYRKYRIVAIYA